MYYENDGVPLPLLQVQIVQGLLRKRLSAPSIGVYQDKDSSREAKCHNSTLEEFKPRLLKRRCRQCS